MKRTLTLALLSLSFAPLAGTSSALAGTISDGDFNAWILGASNSATGTATVDLQSTGGNPDARLAITTVSGSLVYGTAIKSDFASLAALEGAGFTLALDVLAGPGSFGGGQAVQILVEQNGGVYGGGYLNTTGVPAAWVTQTFAGTFSASNFNLLSGAGAANPDFSGGTLTRFGFAAGNEKSGSITQYYDNFSLDSAVLTPVPEPETYALMLAGLGLVGLALQRRKPA